MTYAFMSGREQPDLELRVPQGQVIAGAAIGILVLDLWYPLLPGNVANASTYDFPVLYERLEGATGEMIFRADPALLEMIVEGGRKLEKQGARAIIGVCGYFASYQQEASAALDAPVFLSSLLQAPLVAHSLKPGQKVGIVCADSESLTADTLGACGITDLSTVVVAGAQNLTEFKNIIRSTGRFNSAQIERELVGLAQELVAEHPEVGAILLECSDMPPYAWAIQNAVRRPVFDYVTLIRWVHSTVVRRRFAGFM